MITRITILWLKNGCRFKTWKVYKDLFLMNVLSVSPVHFKKYQKDCPTIEDLLQKLQPVINEVFLTQFVYREPNPLTEITESMAENIGMSHVHTGTEELLQLILLLSQNFPMFGDSLDNFLISHFFASIKKQRVSYELIRAEQDKFEQLLARAQEKFEKKGPFAAEERGSS